MAVSESCLATSIWWNWFTKTLEKRFSSIKAAYSIGDFRQSSALSRRTKMQFCLYMKINFSVACFNDILMAIMPPFPKPD